MNRITNIDLLRHGETLAGNCFCGSSDVPLTGFGLDQMRAAVQGHGPWDRVIASPLQRCAVFAAEIARRHSLPLAFDKRIQELRFGAWEGRAAVEIMSEDPASLENFWADPVHHPPPGGESLTEFQARVLAAWNGIINLYAGQRMLVVTHGGVIRVLLCHARNLPVGRLLDIEAGRGTLHSLRVPVKPRAERHNPV